MEQENVYKYVVDKINKVDKAELRKLVDNMLPFVVMTETKSLIKLKFDEQLDEKAMKHQLILQVTKDEETSADNRAFSIPGQKEATKLVDNTYKIPDTFSLDFTKYKAFVFLLL